MKQDAHKTEEVKRFEHDVLTNGKLSSGLVQKLKDLHQSQGINTRAALVTAVVDYAKTSGYTLTSDDVAKYIENDFKVKMNAQNVDEISAGKSGSAGAKDAGKIIGTVLPFVAGCL